MVYISRIHLDDSIWEIAATEVGVCGICPQVTFVHAPENEISQLAARQLRDYWSGNLQTFRVPLDLNGTAFQKAVWSALSEIPYGETRCYSQIAQQLGRPSAVRAVAGAIGKNPCLVLIPCHRVLGKNGSLTGFSGGLDLKRRLLQLEGIQI